MTSVHRFTASLLGAGALALGLLSGAVAQTKGAQPPPETPATTPQDATGLWAGEITQNDGQSYEAVVILSEEGRGFSIYPSLDCAGTLAEIAPGRYAEVVTFNRAAPGSTTGCIDGEVALVLEGERLSFEWSGEWLGYAITATGLLDRR